MAVTTSVLLAAWFASFYHTWPWGYVRHVISWRMWIFSVFFFRMIGLYNKTLFLGQSEVFRYVGWMHVKQVIVRRCYVLWIIFVQFLMSSCSGWLVWMIRFHFPSSLRCFSALFEKFWSIVLQVVSSGSRLQVVAEQIFLLLDFHFLQDIKKLLISSDLDFYAIFKMGLKFYVPQEMTKLFGNL